MRQKAGTQKAPAEQVVKDIRRATRKQYGAEEKIRIVLEGLRGEVARLLDRLQKVEVGRAGRAVARRTSTPASKPAGTRRRRRVRRRRRAPVRPCGRGSGCRRHRQSSRCAGAAS